MIPFWFIFKKAGFSPWLAVLMFVPLANIIILYVVAFSEWKVVPVWPYIGDPASPAVVSSPGLESLSVDPPRIAASIGN